MAQPEQTKHSDAQPADDVGHTVYRRVEVAGSAPPDPDPPESARPRSRAFAPALTPLVIGFTLLLVVISMLGYLSTQKMSLVSSRVLELETQHSARLSLLLKLRLAITKVNNEARIVQDAESRSGLKPPFDVRLGNAREEVNDLLPQLEHPPL